MKSKEHIIKSVEAGSIAQEMEIEAVINLVKKIMVGKEEVFLLLYVLEGEFI